MSFINNDFYAFTGREMKALAKFCGDDGRLIIAGQNLYASDKRTSCALRVKYYESMYVSSIDAGVKSAAIPFYAFEKMEDNFLTIPAVLIPKTLKVNDVVKIHTDGRMSVNDDFSAGCTADVPDDGGERINKACDFLDKLFDGGELTNEAEMKLAPTAVMKLAGLIDGFKFHDGIPMRVSVIDTGFHKHVNADGNPYESPAIHVSITDSNFGGTTAKGLGKREHIEFDFIYMGMLNRN